MDTHWIFQVCLHPKGRLPNALVSNFTRSYLSFQNKNHDYIHTIWVVPELPTKHTLYQSIFCGFQLKMIRNGVAAGIGGCVQDGCSLLQGMGEFPPQTVSCCQWQRPALELRNPGVYSQFAYSAALLLSSSQVFYALVEQDLVIVWWKCTQHIKLHTIHWVRICYLVLYSYHPWILFLENTRNADII